MRKTVTAAVLLVLAGASAARAQTATVGVSVEIAPVVAIGATGVFSFPAATEAAYDAGYLESTAGPSLAHRGNVPYRVTLQAQAGSTFDFTNYSGRSDANPNKPVGDLRLLSTIGTTAVDVALPEAGSPADFYTRATRGGLQSSTLTARLALDWDNDPPGTYSTTVVFTIVAQ
jgi:hypothetical protein